MQNSLPSLASPPTRCRATRNGYAARRHGDLRHHRRQARGRGRNRRPVKATTPAALDALRRDGLRIVMLTGDNRTTAQAVAKRLAISEVEAEVLPDHKSDVVTRLRREGRVGRDGWRWRQRCTGARSGRCRHRHGHRYRCAMESAGVTLIKGDLAASCARARCRKP